MSNLKSALDQQGALADQKLKAQGLILTQGGEPTFVPHDTSKPEWNVEALGEEKLFYARKLARQLIRHLYPGAVVLQAFGKQYPGEPLPRWQIGIYRSRSGEPVWLNLEQLRLDQPDIPDATSKQAKDLIQHLLAELKVDDVILDAYEDFEAHLRFLGEKEVAEELLPRFSRKNRSYESTKLSDKEFEKWKRFFEPAGWVLPLLHEDGKWTANLWDVFHEREVALFPGDSPVGLRLPLKMLPEDTDLCALTVECKNGELIVFLPPISSFEAFCEVVNAIERVAAKLKLPPVRLEGYAPPSDEDLESIAFMSDPGVIEVNLPPAADWAEFDRVVRGLYQAAEASELRGYKYQLSGRLVSSGGGAHIILGGPDVNDNPFIKRPKMLASFIRFFQHHPSLSYLFTGLFTGPSSQAPRVDETLSDLPYELEITLRALEKMSTPGDRELIDAMLRNLLMDWNGNTHRAEISVDKFYNQDAPNGRHGLVEFRAFEMTPTPDMHLAENLLLRALGAAFAEQPFDKPLVQWKEALGDRFALPSLLREDLKAVLDYLNGFGFGFKPEWFEAHLNFRFPVVHEFETGGTRWTLRQAIERWPVMGEHTGTGRVVDGTTDRLELRAEGDDAENFIATVYDRRLPMQKLDDGSAVCGIRYRLFNNPWGLQPQVFAHTPLQFEIIEAKTQTVAYAFDYHNWKRDTDDYDGLPKDETEARRRVAERLVIRDRQVGKKATIPDAVSIAPLQYTLDLRRYPSE